MSRPITALAWKEWREQRPIVLAGVLLSALLPVILLAGMEAAGRSWTFGSLVHALPAVNVMIVWPLLAVIAGSTTISNEMAEGTLGFILTRPVARRTVWLMKVIFGLLTVTLVALASLGVYWACRFAITGGVSGVPFESSIELVLNFNPTVELIVACVFFIFTAGVFFSTFVSRALTAAAAGILFSLMLLPALFLVWIRIDVSWVFEAGFIGIEICLAGFLTLCSSMYLFTRDEGRRRVGRSLMTGIGMISGGLLLVSAPIVYAHVRVSPEAAYVDSALYSAGAQRVVAELTPQNSLVREIWSIPLNGRDPARLTGRYAEFQSVSPNGRWVAYLSNRGLLGLRSDSYALRVAGIGGGEDHLIAADVAREEDDFIWSDAEFSPDGTMLAHTVKGTLYVRHIATGDSQQAALNGSHCTDAGVIGWTRGGEKVLLFSTPTCLMTFDPSSGRYSTVFTGEDDSRVSSDSPVAGYRYIPLVSNIWSEVKTISVVDIESRERRIISSSACSSGGISRDGLLIGYAMCEQEGDGYRSDLRLHDLESGSERSLGLIRGRSYNFVISPTGKGMTGGVLESIDLHDTQKSFIVTDQGELRRFEGWLPLGWNGRDSLVIWLTEGEGRFALADVLSGQVEVFPR